VKRCRKGDLATKQNLQGKKRAIKEREERIEKRKWS
jgi:hypothetical protein